MSETASILTGVNELDIKDIITRSKEPLLFKSVYSEWPAVKASQVSDSFFLRYLMGFNSQSTVNCFESLAEERYFYNDDASGMNFVLKRRLLADVLQDLEQISHGQLQKHCYVGSTTIKNCLPNFLNENPFLIPVNGALGSLWLGNQSRIAAHYDVPENLACVVSGTRTFTLFPPDQIKNLYVGPLDFTPAGQAISLVDFKNPDFERFPKFRQALKKSITLTLEPGDLIYIPSLWWHHVESHDDVNMLVNFWWSELPNWNGRPMDALLHGILALKALPKEQREGWKSLLDYYIFSDDMEHNYMPDSFSNNLPALNSVSARKLRAMLINSLNG